MTHMVLTIDTAAVKFVYLNRAEGAVSERSKDYRPYDLVVVSREEVEPEHFTMSATGVVHVQPNQPTEYISLSDWMKESTTFNVLRRIRFFKYYLVHRCFRLWYKNAHYLKYAKRRTQLAKTYFLAKHTFSPTLMKINRLSYELQDISIMEKPDESRKSESSFRIEEFLKNQQNKRSQSTQEFQSTIETIESLLVQLCESVTSRSRIPDMNSSDNIEAYLKGNVPENDDTYVTKKSKSMVDAKREAQERARALKKAKEETDMLGTFIRLCDYMCVESLVTLCKDTLSTFKLQLQKEQILFQVFLLFQDNSDILFQPSELDILRMFRRNSDEMIQVVNQVSRLLYMRRFKIYFDGLDKMKNASMNDEISQHLHVDKVIQADEVYSSVKTQIEKMLQLDFAKAIQHGSSFDKLKKWYVFGAEWDATKYAQTAHSVAKFSSDMGKVNDALDDLKRMIVSQELGILYVDSKQLRSTLEPIMRDIMRQIRESINRASSRMCRELNVELKKRVKILKEEPAKLDEFATFIDNLKTIEQESRELMTRAEDVEKMYELAKNNQVEISLQDSVEHDQLRENCEEFTRSIEEANEFRYQHLAEKTAELNKEIDDVNRALFNTIADLKTNYSSTEVDMAEVLEKLDVLGQEINDMKASTIRYSRYQELFDIKSKEWSNLKDVEKLYRTRKKIWQTIDEFTTCTQRWDSTDIQKLDVRDVEKQVQQFFGTAHNLNRDPQIKDDVTQELFNSVKVWRDKMPVVLMIGNSDMKAYHWSQIFKGMGRDENFTSYDLQTLAKIGIFEYKDLISEISAMATGEAELIHILDKIESSWKGMEFTIVPYRKQDVYILGSTEPIFQLLEDNQVLLQTVLASQYVVGVKKRVEEWETKLSNVAEVLEEWLTCQKNWAYLEFIFSSDDIKRQLHEEAAKFASVDAQFRELMNRTNLNRNVVDQTNADGVLEMLTGCNTILEEVQRNLEDFLETKREAFPRFFFLSNDELLEILSQTREPKAVQPHLSKCFDNIKKLQFKDDARHDILAMISAEGERVEFSQPVIPHGNVEYWLLNVEAMMRQSLHDTLKECLFSYDEQNRDSWITSFPAQCVLTCEQIHWTKDVSQALTDIENDANKNALKEYRARFVRLIDGMVRVVRQPDMHSLHRTIVNALLVVDVHARDVIDRLIQRNCSSTNDFDWTMQLRYYWEDDINNCTIRQGNASFLYGYEYLGNQPRLVITPLTDRCYMTCTGALNLFLGAAPQGPAGTGKTESVKDLAKALARQCVVFNCSEGLKVKMMSRMFAGLAQAGAWACFDEFNRIDIEVLSVVAQYMRIIQRAIMAKEDHFLFDDREIKLNSNYGVFITMNPGYAGRTELPDNLKALFRPMAMMIPDYALIAEIMLFSEGFATARNLAQKMTRLFKLSSEQLSKQDHYDFGMRAVKSILVTAGALKRKDQNLSEDVVLIRAMRDSNVPKFLREDVVLFMAIIQDLFPGLVLPDTNYGELVDAIESDLTKNNLQVVPEYAGKILQLHETMAVRHGVMLVGEAGTGKTTAYRTLQNAMTHLHETRQLFEKVNTHILNPKSIRMEELYGDMSEQTHEWHDGIVAKIARSAVEDRTHHHHWVVFDGPVDALWIENMNTVLDDNKMLCLTNGQRIKLPHTVISLFEVRDLAVASPATVSRCGMVYLEESHLDGVWRPMIKSWLQQVEKRLPEKVDHIAHMVDVLVGPTLHFLRKECKEYIRSVNSNLVSSMMHLFDALTVPARGVDLKTNLYHRDRESSSNSATTAPTTAPSTATTVIPSTPEQPTAGENEPDQGGIEVTESHNNNNSNNSNNSSNTSDIITVNASKLVDMYLVFAYIWSLGANLDDNSRAKFNTFASDLIRQIAPDFPDEGTVFDYFVDIESQTYKLWEGIVPMFDYEPTLPFSKMLVPTVDTVKHQYLMDVLLSVRRNILITGASGVGKTMAINQFLTQHLKTEDTKSKYMSIHINLSAQTTSKNLQDIIQDKLESKRKTLLGAPAGKSAIIFIDDLNMPKLEQYGAQPPIELLRQTIDQGGFYDRQKLFFINVRDTSFIAACAPPGGGRNEVTSRLLRHFHMINMPLLTEKSMYTIFSSILAAFFSEFSGAVFEMVNPVVAASLDMYDHLKKHLLPRPSTSHYTFNLRDLSKLFQGILQAHPNSLKTKEQVAMLWTHEGARVFCDRLVSSNDTSWFHMLQQDMLEQHFALSVDTLTVQEIVFTDIMAVEEGMYEQIFDLNALAHLLQDNLLDYNVEKNSEIDLVFFKDAIQHLLRVYRIIQQPRGNALLVGVGGSGRHSLVRLAAYIAGYACLEIEVTRNFKHSHFREALKQILLNTGCEGKPTVFLFSDTQILEESFLEDIHNILNSGEIVGLYEPEDMERIMKDVRPKVKELGLIETKDVIFRHFVNLIRENLHICLCMNPIGNAFRTRLRMFPSLVNNCTIDWYSEWPNDALFSVAKNILQDDVFVRESGMVDNICQLCVYIHTSVASYSTQFLNELRRHNYTTPTSYIELVKLYTKMLGKRHNHISSQLEKFRGGLKKLSEANESVGKLQGYLTEQKPILDQAVKDTASLAVQIEEEKKQADEVRKVVAQERLECQDFMEKTQVIRDDCQEELNKALPAFKLANDAVGALSPQHIYEIKSMKNPSQTFKVLMETICLLFNKKPTWEETVKMLSDTNFLKNLKEFDKDKIQDATLKKLKRYLDLPNLQLDTVRKQTSEAGEYLCTWVHNIYTYAHISRNIKPKQQALETAEQELNAAKEVLARKEQSLAQIEQRVADLEFQLQEAERKRKQLQFETKQTEDRLVRAEKLLSGLSGEEGRWKHEAELLDVQMNNLLGDILLAAGSVAYLGPFNSDFRHRMIRDWSAQCKEISVSSNFALTSIVDPIQLREWNIQGLPSDSFSNDNAVLVTTSNRWPLMIDPQGQAIKWIKNMERSSGLRIIKANDRDLSRKIEAAIRIGAPTLIENVGEELDPVLEPVLLKQTFREGSRLMIRLGDQNVDYNSNFKLYLTSKLPNPHYMPEVCIKVTIINFTVTEDGLEDQLLADVVRSERLDLEQEKDSLTTQIAEGKNQLKETQDKILSLLYQPSETNILDDEVLIATLNSSKVVSEKVSNSLEKAEQTAKEIDATRESYRPVATRGSILYFVVSSMSEVDPMYQNSLQFFKTLFNKCLKEAQQSSDLGKRLDILISYITDVTYDIICRGLFEKDKLLFSFLMTVQIMKQQGSILDNEWKYFLRGNPERSPSPITWLSDPVWNQLVGLERLGGFFDLTDSIKTNETRWRSIYSSDDILKEVLPDPFESVLSQWRKLLLIKALREEKLIFSINRLVSTYLGPKFVINPQPELDSVFKDTSCNTPIIFVLSSGADPQVMFDKLVEDKEYSEHVLRLSLGKGQGKKAAQFIAQAMQSGDWVFLQNCHLAVSWMPELERLVEDIVERKETNPNFRLWLTSMPTPKFPVSVLQSSIKITNEPPKGLKSNIQRSFKELDDQTYENCTKPREWKKLAFGLIFFHALIQERKKFGSLGWNVPYEWNASDLDASLRSLKSYLNEQPTVSWDALRYTIGVIHYGGRVTDFLDLRCVESLLSKFFRPEIVNDDSYMLQENSETYYAPPESELEKVRLYISQLPSIESPEVFGLHENANITYQQKETKELLDTIIAIQPRSASTGSSSGSSASGNSRGSSRSASRASTSVPAQQQPAKVKSSNDIVLEMVRDFLERLPVPLDASTADSSTFCMGENGTMNCLGTFLSQEIFQFNKLLRIIRKSLEELQNAVNGFVLMSSALEVMYSCFLYQKVPDLWSNHAYPSRKSLQSWFVDLCHRISFLRKWITNGPPNCFEISCFFFPQGFLTSVLQTHARRYLIAIDKLVFRTTVLNKTDCDDPSQFSAPKIGVYIRGLHLQGARWDTESDCLVESHSGELFTEMPTLWLEPIEVASPGTADSTDSSNGSAPTSAPVVSTPTEKTYDCPVYKTTSRAGSLSTTGISTNFVMTVQLNTGLYRSADHWTQRGVALLLETD